MSEEREEIEDLGLLPKGHHLFRKPNGAGGHRYFSDELVEGVHVWDTCLVDPHTLLAAIVAEEQRRIQELNQKQQTDRNMEIERAVATGASFLCPIPKKEVK